MPYVFVGRWCVNRQITYFKGSNNIRPWTRTDPTHNPKMKASTKGIYLGPQIKEVNHYESDNKSLVVKCLYQANNVRLSSKPRRNDLETNGIIRGRFLKLPDKSTIIHMTNSHLMLDNLLG